MPGLATLTNLGAGAESFDFVCVNFGEGWYKPTEENIVEEITAAGAIGSRMRIFRTDYRRFIMEALADYTSLDAAIAAHDLSFKLKGTVCSFVITADGVTYTPVGKMFVWDVKAAPFSSEVVGANLLNAAPLAMVKYTFECQFTAEPVSP